ncbi:unnamed protein product, partial [Linum tenue]
GLLAAHPVTPLLSLHHIDVINPILPKASRLQSLQRLTLPMTLDPPALMQQSICYDHKRHRTVSVSWGHAVQIVRGTVSPREMEMPVRTFVNWHKKADYSGYAFNTRSVHPTTAGKKRDRREEGGGGEEGSRWVKEDEVCCCGIKATLNFNQIYFIIFSISLPFYP